MDLKISKEEFQNLNSSKHGKLKLILVCQNNNLEEFLEREYEKLTEERHFSLGVPLKLFYENEFILRYSSMSKFFVSSFDEAIEKNKFVDFRRDNPDWSQICPWVGKTPSEEEIKSYYTEKFSISPRESVIWGIIYISSC